MHKFLGLLLAGSLSLSAFAETANRKVASTDMTPGSYQCENEHHEMIASFYVNKKGTSKKVRINDVRDDTSGSGVEGCSMVDFQWIGSGAVVKNAHCCPFGAN